jgi:hypothetical protein
VSIMDCLPWLRQPHSKISVRSFRPEHRIPNESPLHRSMAVDLPSAPKGDGLSREAMKGEGSRSSRYIPAFGGSATANKAGANSGKFRTASRIDPVSSFSKCPETAARRCAALSFLNALCEPV